MTKSNKAPRVPKNTRVPTPPSAASLKFAQYLARRMAPMIEKRQQAPTQPAQDQQ
jgi:hypothetical protein